MVFRKSGPGVVGRAAKTAARTALITATATTVANKMSRGSRPETPAAPNPESAAPQPQAAGGLSEDAMARLAKLAELHKSGILTDAEFAEQKAKLLG